MIDWEECLARSGYRITASRRAVIHVLARTTIPLSPQDILEQAQAMHRELGLVTVYRLLNLLTDLNLVRRIHLEGGCHGYVPASPGHHHALVCQGCGQAVEFCGNDDLDDFITQVEARTGYRVKEHLLQLFGLCPVCLDRQV
jgi:Fur family ferric uptake transcriptional regulator